VQTSLRLAPCKLIVDTCQQKAYMWPVIKSFRSKALADLFAGKASKIDSRMHKRILTRLDVLDSVSAAKEMDRPGYSFHPLHGLPKRYSVHVNGPWCLTFEFEGTDAYRVDFEQYH
jgi:proteic killer suppression protein